MFNAKDRKRKRAAERNLEILPRRKIVQSFLVSYKCLALCPRVFNVKNNKFKFIDASNDFLNFKWKKVNEESESERNKRK